MFDAPKRLNRARLFPRQIISLRMDVVNMSQLSTLSFSDAVRSFLQDCKLRNLTVNTYDYYKFGLRILEQFMEAKNIEFVNLTPFDLSNRFMNYMIDQELSSSTIRGRICACQVFFKYLYQEGILQTNIAADLKLIKANNQAIFTFSEEQIIAVLKQPDTTSYTGLRDYIMMLLLLETGMRVMELSNMNVSDIDFENGTIRILSGKGRKPRIVPIQKTCLYELDRYIRDRGYQAFDNLWVTIHNTPFQLSTIKLTIINHCKAAHIQGTRGSAHTFRHTMAKCYLLNGGDVFSLMYILGHTNIEMTKKYVDLFNRDLHIQHQKASPIEMLSFPQNEKHGVET
jgi:integrase/recombinase XerD